MNPPSKHQFEEGKERFWHLSIRIHVGRMRLFALENVDDVKSNNTIGLCLFLENENTCMGEQGLWHAKMVMAEMK